MRPTGSDDAVVALELFQLGPAKRRVQLLEYPELKVPQHQPAHAIDTDGHSYSHVIWTAPEKGRYLVSTI
jgi:hypothetical protein